MSQDKAHKENIVLAAGGTGGHMFPARALATDLISRGFSITLMTDERGMKYSADWDDMTRIQISSATFGANIFNKLMGLCKLATGYFSARAKLKKLNPLVVVGFGGYPSLPPMVAAQKLRLPTIIHEQNAILGKANAFLAPKADRIATAMPNLTGLDEADSIRCVVTGNPVRRDVAALYMRPYPSYNAQSTFNIFVIGGSQGASVFANVIPDALDILPETLRQRIHIVQQCRTQDEVTKTTQRYESMGLTALINTFIDDVAQQLDQAHLVIARSGASTVAEVATAGRPAIFVPYPYHADQQQKINAQSIANSGGAWLFEEKDFKADTLARKLEALMEEPETLFRAAEASRSCAKPDAARKLGNLVTAIAYGWNKEEQKPYDYTQGRI